ncbi:MAG: hypothetical protein QOI25_5376 [Mycobacterium sp.]|nr:hypothetical protein [Mycobacterium sp.]
MTAQPKVFEAQSATVPCGFARRWPAVWSVMAGIFVIVTAEILPIGLLLPISAEFAVSPGTSGLMMTVPGLVAAVAAPLATVATAHVDRRLMLSVWLVVLAASNLVSAVASEFWMVLAARVLVGIVIGGFWSIGAGLACRLVDERSVARATSTIFLAVPLGSVLGVPIGTFIADVAGWRTAFVCLGVATLVVVAALVATLPALPPEQVTRVAVLGALLARRQVRIGLLLTFTIVVAHFGTYIYVSAFLEEVTRVDLGTISVLLLIFGAAGLVGNLIAGVTIAKNLRPTFAAAACLIAIATVGVAVRRDRGRGRGWTSDFVGRGLRRRARVQPVVAGARLGRRRRGRDGAVHQFLPGHHLDRRPARRVRGRRRLADDGHAAWRRHRGRDRVPGRRRGQPH